MQARELEQVPGRVGRRAASTQAQAAAGPLAAPTALLTLQRLAGNRGVGSLLAGEEDDGWQTSPVREVVESGGGGPIDPDARSFLEARLGFDFSDVRVHTGAGADRSARSIGAQAYTVGTDVVFRAGAYQPDSAAGRHVLAHELAHVIQQKAGPVDGSPAPGGIRLSDPSDPFERAAQRAADDALDVEQPGEEELPG